MKPVEHSASYVNRKGFFSLLLQGVCDDQKLFTDVFAGVAGSVHDARLFQLSDLYQRIQDNLIEFPNNSHLIGDLAYPLSDKLIVGFKNNGNLNNLQQNFNRKLNKARVVIEHAFAFLKGRFRRLKYLETIRLDLASLLIVSSCILHNICILHEDLPNDYVNINDNLMEELEIDMDNIYNYNNEPGAFKRNEIMINLLN